MDQLTKKIIVASNHIVIIGLAGSGKSTFLEKLLEEEPGVLGHRVFKTDDYMAHGYEESLYALMRDVSEYERLESEGTGRGPYAPWIIEGVQGYRLLRKIVQGEADIQGPDLVIEVQAPAHVRADRFRDRGKDFTHSLDKNLTKVWNDYKNAGGNHRLITVQGHGG